MFPVRDGVLVVPDVLPFHVPSSAYELTVAEWLNLPTLKEVPDA